MKEFLELISKIPRDMYFFIAWVDVYNWDDGYDQTSIGNFHTLEEAIEATHKFGEDSVNTRGTAPNVYNPGYREYTNDFGIITITFETFPPDIHWMIWGDKIEEASRLFENLDIPIFEEEKLLQTKQYYAYQIASKYYSNFIEECEEELTKSIIQGDTLVPYHIRTASHLELEAYVEAAVKNDWEALEPCYHDFDTMEGADELVEAHY